MSADRKYNDRDVRDNPDLRLVAIDYLEQYTGEFDYLIEMKQRLALDMELTDPMVRGVLNCMRHDPRIDGMPEVVLQTESAYSNVVAFRKPTKKSRGRLECPLFANGIYHHHKMGWTVDFPISCRGLYRINRQIAVMDAKIHTKYVVARQGSVVHRATGVGWTRWYPPGSHEYGFADWTTPELIAGVECMIRSVKSPMLFFDREVAVGPAGVTDVPDPRPKRQGEFLPLCKRCF